MFTAEYCAYSFSKNFKKNFKYYPFDIKTVKEGKWWTHFVRLINNLRKFEIDNIDEFMNYSFTRFIKENNKKLYPFFFSTKEGTSYMKEFEGYKFVEKENKDYDLTEEEEIFNTLKLIKSWTNKNKKTAKDFFKDSLNLLSVERERIYFPIALCSKTYVESDRNQEDLFTIRIILNKFEVFYPKVYEGIKKLLGDDFLLDS